MDTSGCKYFTFDGAGVTENPRYNMQSLQVTRSEEKCVQKCLLFIAVCKK